jgi:hypothetical protein
MKNKIFMLTAIFLFVGSSIAFGMELEGQDDTGDFLIAEMDNQYPRDTEYLAGAPSEEYSEENREEETPSYESSSMADMEEEENSEQDM